VTVIDAEEADSNSIFGGDEVSMEYGLALTTGGSLDYGTSGEFLGGWFADAYGGNVFRDVTPLKRSVDCAGKIAVTLNLYEDDGIMGGTKALGQPYNLELNLATETRTEIRETADFMGRSEDGTYHYQVAYILSIGR
jgi:hypothetical protein